MKLLVVWWLISATTFSACQACRSRASIVETTQQGNSNYASQPKGTDMEIIETEATRIAETFLAHNGYTSVPPSEDKSTIVYESSDPPDEALALRWRSNTLEPKAYAARRRQEPPGWIVVFRYNAANALLRSVMPDFDERVELWGRAVVMDLNGEKPRLEHQDVKLEPH